MRILLLLYPFLMALLVARFKLTFTYRTKIKNNKSSPDPDADLLLSFHQFNLIRSSWTIILSVLEEEKIFDYSKKQRHHRLLEEKWFVNN